MDRSEILELVKKNQEKKTVRDLLWISMKDLRKVGMRAYRSDFDSLVESLGGNIPAAKLIVLHSMAPDTNIPVIDKEGNVLYQSATIVTSDNYKKTPQSRTVSVAVFSDGSYVVDRGGNATVDNVNLCKVSNNEEETVNFLNPTMVVSRKHYEEYCINYNGMLPQWSIDLRLKSNSGIDYFLQQQLINRVATYLNSIPLGEMLAHGAEGLQLPVDEFIMQINNMLATGMLKEEKQVRYSSISFSKEIAAKISGVSPPDDVVFMDDPFSHEYFKEKKVLEFFS